MISLGQLLIQVIELYKWVLIATIILSWLLAFDVVNRRNRFVDWIMRVAFGLTEPVLAPIRRVVPAVSGLDLSPLVLFFGLWFIQSLIVEYWIRPLIGS